MIPVVRLFDDVNHFADRRQLWRFIQGFEQLIHGQRPHLSEQVIDSLKIVWETSRAF